MSKNEHSTPLPYSKRWVVWSGWWIVLFFCHPVLGQSDSTAVATVPTVDSLTTDSVHSFMDDHPPRKAVILSAMLPGAGQFYNKKYWKIPLVYAGLGISAYYLNRNNGDITYYRKHLKAAIDDDPNTINLSGLSSNDLSNRLNDSKRLRDLSYISIAGFYILQIIDANVDAHLWHFDVSNDLGLQIGPSLLMTDITRLGLGIKINF